MAASSYVLPEAESQRIFDEEIEPVELGQQQQQPQHDRQPLAVLMVGQTGAGKTRLAPVLRAAMEEVAAAADAKGGGAEGRPTAALAHLVADTYKAYHPAYARLAAEAPGMASAATGPDARRWLAMACDRAAARHLDVLVESACRHPDDFIALAAAFRRAAYRVCIAVLAVPYPLSRLGLLARFYGRLPEAQAQRGVVDDSGSSRPLPPRMPPRLTPPRVHDDSYAGLADAARFLDASGTADAVAVVRRGNLAAFETRARTGAGVEAALEAERRRSLTEEELRAAETDLKMLEALGDPEVRERAEEIRGLMVQQAAASVDEGFPELRPLDAAGFVGAGVVN